MRVHPASGSTFGLLLALGAASACGGAPVAADAPRSAGSTSPGQPFRLATGPNPEGSGMQALLTGRLRGDPRSGCVWIVAGRHRYAVVWPRGFTARWRPLRVYRASGELVAREGQALESGGGHVPAATASWRMGDRPLTPCIRRGEVWAMTDAAAPGTWTSGEWASRG